MSMQTSSADGHQIVVILDDDLMITEGLAAGLARDRRTIVTCNDLEGGELVVEWLKPTHVVSDVRLTGAFGYEGLDFIRFVKRLSKETRIIMMTGDPPDALQLEASERGAAAFLTKPFEVHELDALIDMLASSRSGSSNWPAVIRVPLLDDVLANGLLATVFQPVVRITSGERVGCEALTRCRSDSLFRNPETLFQYASRKQRVIDLEIAACRNALRSGAALAASAPLFLNVHPAVFRSRPSIAEAIVSAARAAGVTLDRVVLEITEQASLTNDPRVIEMITQLKAEGVRFAFDDVGVAYSHLPFIDCVRPSFIKISQAFGTNFETDSTKTKIVRNLRTLAADFGCDLILEGVESASTAAAAVDLGIEYGQGYYFGAPADAEALLDLSKIRTV